MKITHITIGDENHPHTRRKSQESDFLYREELEALVSSKDLIHLAVAFSRDQAVFQKYYAE